MSGTDPLLFSLRKTHRSALLLLSVFGIGLIPSIQGTIASALTLFPLWLLGTSELSPTLQLSLVAGTVVILTALSVTILSRLAPALEHDMDRSWIVIDEVIGMALTLFPLFSLHLWRWWSVAAAFVIFRVLDIWKPLVIRRIDQWNTPASVLLDDIVAGIIGSFLLTVFLAGW
jgi:phosphatidylglycerophosphatase A